jgi:hypothetical protein
MKKDPYNLSYCSLLFDNFTFVDKKNKHIALVFEKLGKSLYDFIRENKYRGIFETKIRFPNSHSSVVC